MKEPEFNKYADEYAALHQDVLGPSGESVQFFAEYKAVDTAKEIRRRLGGARGKVLDFGCGIGGATPYLLKHLSGWDLTGVDVSDKSLDVAEKRFGDRVNFIHFDGKKLAFQDNWFDVVCTACVFHHIPPSDHPSLFRELQRVTKPGGLFIIFEHNPLNPLTLKAVHDCPFDENAILIRGKDCVAKLKTAGFSRIKLNYRIFFPSILRWLRPLERYMTWLPIGAQYYVCAEKPASQV